MLPLTSLLISAKYKLDLGGHSGLRVRRKYFMVVKNDLCGAAMHSIPSHSYSFTFSITVAHPNHSGMFLENAYSYA